MDQNTADQISETILCRVTKGRLNSCISDLGSLKSQLMADLPINDQDLAKILSNAQSKRIIKIQNDADPFVSITDETATGVQRLIRKFCKRYYGEVSPLIDRKTIQAVLNRHGADFSLDDQAVVADLRLLEKDGLIRMIGKDEGYLKLLGAE